MPLTLPKKLLMKNEALTRGVVKEVDICTAPTHIRSSNLRIIWCRMDKSNEPLVLRLPRRQADLAHESDRDGLRFIRRGVFLLF